VEVVNIDSRLKETTTTGRCSSLFKSVTAIVTIGRFFGIADGGCLPRLRTRKQSQTNLHAGLTFWFAKAVIYPVNS
jgi:hypothetical protein